MGGKCLRIIKDMYSKVKSCVRLHGGLSDSFEIPVGLKQGEIMSPLLWALFIEDLELFLQGDFNSDIQIDELEIILLLFADDLVIHSQLSRTCLIGSLAYQQIDEKLDVNRKISEVSGVWRTLTVCNG